MPLYGNFPAIALGKDGATQAVNWLTDTIKVALTTSAYTPNQDSHDYYNDLTNELSTANGYTSGGVTLGSKTVTYDSGTNESRYDAADAQWT